MFFIKSGEVEISKLIVVNNNDENVANSVNNDMNFSNYVGSSNNTAVTS